MEKNGETLNYEEGNEDGSDFFSEDPVQPQPSDNRFKDMNAPGREKPDTGTNKPSKPADKKDIKPADPITKPEEKKGSLKEKPQPKNEY